MFEVTDEVRAVARMELDRNPPSVGLRRLSERFHLQKIDLAWVATEVFHNMLVPDVEAIWNWDFAGNGEGHPDAELDALLSHLFIHAGPVDSRRNLQWRTGGIQ